jgi:hypothetical protein
LGRSTRSVRYGAQGRSGNETQQHQFIPTLFIPLPHFPVPHLFSPPPLCQFSLPTFLQVLDHPLSTLRGGGQAPIPYARSCAHPRRNPCFPGPFEVWDRAATVRKHDTPPPTFQPPSSHLPATLQPPSSHLPATLRARNRPFLRRGCDVSAATGDGGTLRIRGESCLPSSKAVREDLGGKRTH